MFRMDHESLLAELIHLNESEAEGKKFFLTHGNPMSYRQLMPLARPYNSSFLREHDFFHEWKNIEIEKNLRYIQIPSHWHEFMEFIYVAKGSCIQKVNQEKFTHAAGDFAVMSPGTSHELIVPEDSLCLTIKIRFSTFNSIHIPCMPMFSLPLLFPCGKDSFVLHTILTMYEQQCNALQYSDEIITGLFTVLITYIIQNYYESMRFLAMTAIKDYKIIQMINFMFENFRSITLKGLAENFHYNEMYLSGLIRKKTGKSFTDIMREFRLSRAEELLRTSPSIKLSAVCDAIGYNDTTNFIRDFKAKYNTTPAKYKKEQRK